MIKNIIDMLKEYDPEVGNSIEAEYKRQKRALRKIKEGACDSYE